MKPETEGKIKYGVWGLGTIYGSLLDKKFLKGKGD